MVSAVPVGALTVLYLRSIEKAIRQPSHSNRCSYVPSITCFSFLSFDNCQPSFNARLSPFSPVSNHTQKSWGACEWPIAVSLSLRISVIGWLVVDSKAWETGQAY